MIATSLRMSWMPSVEDALGRQLGEACREVGVSPGLGSGEVRALVPLRRLARIVAKAACRRSRDLLNSLTAYSAPVLTSVLCGAELTPTASQRRSNARQPDAAVRALAKLLADAVLVECPDAGLELLGRLGVRGLDDLSRCVD
jgi:hypothetical protein